MYEEDSCKSPIIFYSKIWLTFSDSLINKNYKEELEIISKRNTTIQIVLSLVFIIFQINFLIYAYFKYNELFIKFICFLFPTLIINVFSLFFFLKVKKKDKFCGFNFYTIYCVIVSTNYVFLKLNSFALFAVFHWKNNNMEGLLFINSLCYFINLVYVNYLIKHYFLLLILFTFIIPMEMIIIGSLTNVNSFTYSCEILQIISLTALSYCNQVSDMIVYFYKDSVIKYLQKSKQDLIDYLDEMDHLAVVFENGEMIHINQKFLSLLNLNKNALNKSMRFSEIFKDENIIRPDISLKFSSFFQNKLVSLQKDDSHNSLISNGKLKYEIKNVIECILSQPTLINSNISTKLQKILNYFIKIKESEEKFSIEEFSKLVFENENLKKSHLNLEVEENLTEFPLKESNLSNYVNFNITAGPNEIKLEKLTKERNIQINSFYIGRVKLNNFFEDVSEDLEYSLFCRVSQRSKITFFFKNDADILLHEREQTAKICKSLYFSKISHEFKNPLCNLQEIIACLKEELIENKIDLCNTCLQQKKSDDSSEKNDSSYDIFYKNSNIEARDNSLLSKVFNLHFIVEMLNQLVKDFTFYSSFADSETEMKCLPSKKCILRCDNKILNSGQVLNFNKKRGHKECNYLKIIGHLIDLFHNKISLDGMESKINIDIKFTDKLPKYIDMDYEHFQSLIFNILYHIIKNMMSGNISLIIDYDSNLESKIFLNFKFQVHGIMNLNIFDQNNTSRNNIPRKSLKRQLNTGNTTEEVTDVKWKTCIPHIESNIVKNILQTADHKIKNSLVDDFNNNFHYNLASMSAELLGFNLNFESKNQKELMFSFRKEINIENLVYTTNQEINSSVNTKSQKTESKYLDKANTYSSNHFRKLQILDKSYKTKSFDENKISIEPHYSTRNSDKVNTINFPIKEEISTLRTKIDGNNIKFDYCEMKKNQIIREFLIRSKEQERLGLNLDESMKSYKEELDIKLPAHFNTRRSQFSRMKSSSDSSSSLEYKSGHIKTYRQNAIPENEAKLVRVLLCDDEVLIRNTFERFFNKISNEVRSYTFQTFSSANGFECLNKIYELHQEGKFFDLIMIDETMPVIKGSQIIYLLKSCIREKCLENIIIISYTTYNSHDKVQYLYSQGADFVLSKPKSYDEFKTFLLETLLNFT
jgi:CheY-like chemotaxis protein